MYRFLSSHLVRGFGSGAARFHGVLLLLSLGYLIGGLAMGPPLEEGKLTPSFFPLLIGLLATLLCGLQWWSAVRSSAIGEAPVGNARGQRWSPELALMMATLVYVLVFQVLGYTLPTLAYVLTVMLLFSGTDRWWSKAAIALAITVAGYLLFNQVFNVRLPTLWG